MRAYRHGFHFVTEFIHCVECTRRLVCSLNHFGRQFILSFEKNIDSCLTRAGCAIRMLISLKLKATKEALKREHHRSEIEVSSRMFRAPEFEECAETFHPLNI